MSYSLLLAPLKIDSLTLPNRIVMPPLVTFLAEDDGLVTPAHLEHYDRSSGPGLMIVEGTAVSPEGRISRRQLGIYSDRHIEGFARIADIIHGNGSVAGIQIQTEAAVGEAQRLHVCLPEPDSPVPDRCCGLLMDFHRQGPRQSRRIDQRPPSIQSFASPKSQNPSASIHVTQLKVNPS